jgi:hypothetical protein
LWPYRPHETDGPVQQQAAGDIQHVAVLINRTPEVGRFALDGQKNFIDVPRIARPRTTATQRVGVLLPKLRGMC